MKNLLAAFLLPLAIFAQHQPIQIFEGPNAFHGPCEPSIVINPANPATCFFCCFFFEKKKIIKNKIKNYGILEGLWQG